MHLVLEPKSLISLSSTLHAKLPVQTSSNSKSCFPKPFSLLQESPSHLVWYKNIGSTVSTKPISTVTQTPSKVGHLDSIYKMLLQLKAKQRTGSVSRILARDEVGEGWLLTHQTLAASCGKGVKLKSGELFSWHHNLSWKGRGPIRSILLPSQPLPHPVFSFHYSNSPT